MNKREFLLTYRYNEEYFTRIVLAENFFLAAAYVDGFVNNLPPAEGGLNVISLIAL